MSFEPSASRIWRRLSPEDRLLASGAFWARPGEEAGVALAAIAGARRMRPQVARRLDDEAKARILATVLDPSEPLALALLVALHVAHRKQLLTTFLDAASLPHEDGILSDAASTLTLDEAGARRGIEALATRFDPADVRCYLNTLWLQEPARWAVVERGYDAWESAESSGSGTPSGSDSRGGSSSQ